MCLAIPAQVRTINENNLAVVDILGVTREVALDLTPSAQVGDFVLVHAGFAIEVVSEEDAQETLDLIKQIPELADVEGLKADDLNGLVFFQRSRACSWLNPFDREMGARACNPDGGVRHPYGCYCP